MARALNEREGAHLPGVEDLARASAAIERLSLEGGQRSQLTIEILGTALELLERRAAPPSDTMLLGAPFQEEPVRLTLEQAYRDLARLATGDEKIGLVDRANQVRPMTAA
jgi:serine/threonine-protein kinase PknG